MNKVTFYTIFMAVVLAADLGLTALCTIPLFAVALVLPLLVLNALSAALLGLNFGLVKKASANQFWTAASRVSLNHNSASALFCVLFFALRAAIPETEGSLSTRDTDAAVLAGVFSMYLMVRFVFGSLLCTVVALVGLVKAPKTNKKRLVAATLSGLAVLTAYQLGTTTAENSDVEFVFNILKFLSAFCTVSLTCYLTFMLGKAHPHVEPS